MSRPSTVTPDRPAAPPAAPRPPADATPARGPRPARARAAAQADRAERDPGRRRDRERRVHPLPVHRLAGGPRLPVGGGRRHPHAVLHQHGDRALHARDGGDGARRVPAAVEAVRAAVIVAMAILATMWPGWATGAATVTTFLFGGGDPNVDRDRRARRDRRRAHRLAGRLPDGRAAPVPQGRRRARVHRRRAGRRRSSGDAFGTRARSSRASARSRARSSSRSSSARSPPPARAARTTSCRATGSATRASGWASTPRASSRR